MKKVRLIELFSGIGTQAKALERIGVPFVNWKTCEWEVDAFKSYNAIHTQDNTDYSVGKTKEELIDSLYKMGISNDGKKPMEYNSIKRKGEKWLRQTYNDIIATHNMVDITKVKWSDLEIKDIENYLYILTWSFPCWSISLAGTQQGMDKGSGTGSSLLWEVERILKECKEHGELPQVLLMENVPQVISAKNIDNFNTMCKSLEELGYKNKYFLLNAKDFGVPQNRNRCYMVSVLGDYEFEVPQGFELKLRLKDILEDEVDEKYYLSEEKVEKFLATGNVNPSGRGMNGMVNTKDIANTITTNKGEGQKILLKEPRVRQIGNCMPGTNRENPNQGRIYDTDGLAPTLSTMQGGGRTPFIIEDPVICASRGRYNEDGSISQKLEVNDSGCSNTITTVQKDNYVLESQGVVADRDEDIDYILRIRKLTPRECWKLMGFDDEDVDKAIKAGISNSKMYKQAGNSIVVDVLEAIFKNLFDVIGLD